MADLISMDIAYIPEQRDDEWAFDIRDFGFRVYAKTEEEGEKVVREAITALLEALSNDRPRLIKYLDARGVPYRIQKQDAQVKSLTYAGELSASAA